MPTPQDSRQDPPKSFDSRRFDQELDAFETARQKKPPVSIIGGEASGGYRLVGQMLSGMLGGIGLGWLFDRLLHTNPWGLVCGLLIGTGVSIFATVRSAARQNAVDQAKAGPPRAVPDDDDEQA